MMSENSRRWFAIIKQKERFWWSL